MSNFGFVRVGVATPRIEVANPPYNAQEIIKIIHKAQQNKCSIVVFPELSLTGYTCGDLFWQKTLLNKTLESLRIIIEKTTEQNVLAILGLPLLIGQNIYNCAVAVHAGKILGVVPKIRRKDSEKRWFASGTAIQELSEINLLEQKVPCGRLIFQCQQENCTFSLGIEIGEDAALQGTHIIANLSAQREYISKYDYQEQYIKQQSLRSLSGYLYATAGVHESTTDAVFGGESLILEKGRILKRCPKFARESQFVYTEIDVEILPVKRKKTTRQSGELVPVIYNKTPKLENLTRRIDPRPFIPTTPKGLEQAFNIQVVGLAKRLEHTGIKKVTIGVSGGLDSTLALLVTVKAFDLLNISRKNIWGITMPGFGTTDLTYKNSLKLMEKLNITRQEIDIKPACLQHLQDINHAVDKKDTTFENVQARERTQILMDLANKINGLVIGTGDMSELALGWCTYNGDHMSMYAVNSGVSKTLVKSITSYLAKEEYFQEIREILLSILHTPISPELLPSEKGSGIHQKTEDILGPYEVHDFYLYHFLSSPKEPKKLLFLAQQAFGEKYLRSQLVEWLKVFYQRFFVQQFKRSCMPDGPKVSSVNLSPRGDWLMPSDASAKIWLEDLD